MESNAPSSTKSALQFGTLLGIILIVVSLLIYILELYENQITNWASTVFLLIGIVIGVKNRRDKELGGHISYGSALGYGTLVTLFASIISATVSIAYLAFIDDGFIQFTLEQQENKMYEQGLPDEQIEIAMSWTEKFMSPPLMWVVAIISTTFIGFIISLIVGAILKKNEDPFSGS